MRSFLARFAFVSLLLAFSLSLLLSRVATMLQPKEDLSSATLPRTRSRLFANAFHDCVQSRERARDRRQNFLQQQDHRKNTAFAVSENKKRRVRVANENATTPQRASSYCEGGICVGMTKGPHQGGNVSYPLAWNGTAGTRLESTMTVPGYPIFRRNTDNTNQERDFRDITFYIWTDVFFGDESLGRMNQLVPQLILGRALDGSSGPPSYTPEWRDIHKEWAFGTHYFFEVWNPKTNTTDAHAAYGEIFPASPGETIETTFELMYPPATPAGPDSVVGSDAAHGSDKGDNRFDGDSSPAWTLTMTVVGDPSRTSILRVEEPYMGMGKDWDRPSSSWLEPNFHKMCINACWELYGASDSRKLPSTGAEYKLTIEQPMQAATTAGSAAESYPRHPFYTTTGGAHWKDHHPHSPDGDATSGFSKNDNYYDFTTWERDEGNGVCPSCKVSEVHTHRTQKVFVEIDVVANAPAGPEHSGSFSREPGAKPKR